jgi:putative ABC transport system permease protein
MLIFLYAKDEISFDAFHDKKDQIYRIVAEIQSPEGKLGKSASTGMVQGPRFKANIPEIENFVRFKAGGFNVKKGMEVFEQEAFYADESFFSVFSFPLLYGNPQTALKDMYSVVISEDLAIRYFGKTDVVGQTLQLNTGKEFEPFVISAVAKNPPANSSIRANMLVSMKFSEAQQQGEPFWLNSFLNTFVLIKEGTDLKATEAAINRVYQKEAASQIAVMAKNYGYKDKVYYRLQPFLKMHLDTDYPADNGLVSASNPLYSYILIAITGIILLIACINFINLTVARSLKRVKEIGIRKVVGGQRKYLIIQFLGESMVLSFFAFVVAIGLAYLLLPLFNSLSNKALSFSYLLDGKLVLAYLILFFATSFLAGFYPALVLSAFKPVETLYGKFRFTGKNYLSRSLIVFQFSLTTFLIVATFVIYSQFNYLLDFDLGYNYKNVMQVNTVDMNPAQFEVLKSELLKSPSIQTVTAQQGGEWQTMAKVSGDVEQAFDIRHVSADYFSFFRIPVVAGRNFSPEFTSDSTTSVIVNESFVKAAGWKKPIGEIVDFYYNNRKYTVIGVIRDYHFASLLEKVSPQLFSIDPNFRHGQVHLKITEGNRINAMNHAEKVFKKLYPSQPYQYDFLDTMIENNYTSEAKWKQIITFSAILTIFISCIGLFGLASLSAEKRAKEIGIRKVLGASIPLIIRKISADFILLVFIAACIALPLAWLATNKWLENYPYRIALNPVIFGGAALAVVLFAFITVSYQAIKTARENPSKSLRTE